MSLFQAMLGAGGGAVIPSGAILEPDGLAYLKEPDDSYVLEP